MVGNNEVGREVDALVHIETQSRLRGRSSFVPKLWAWNDDTSKGKLFVTTQNVGR